MHIEVCLLSAEETAKLEVYGIWPVCKAHKHVKLKQAAQLIATDMYRSVGGAHTQVQMPVTMITECSNNSYEWRNKPSGGPLGTVTKQFVPLHGH